MGPRLLIVGASARAAAYSALRAGFAPIGVDLFGDVDLARVAPTAQVPLDRYPEGVVDAARGFTCDAWLYLGGFENRPDLVGALLQDHPRLLGNPPEVLRVVRDPFALADALASVGVRVPRLRAHADGLPVDGSWLVKSVASAGGRGVAPWLGVRAPGPAASVYQERVDGAAMSALFVASAARAEFVAATRQLLGGPAGPFEYVGSVGPVGLGPATAGDLRRVGEAVADRFGVRGLFGVDFVASEGRAWPVEVNPRYAASVEVVERATGRALLADHAACFGFEVVPPRRVEAGADVPVVGKRYVHAPSRMTWEGLPAGVGPGRVADVPRPGTVFEAGDPVLTTFARSTDPDRVARTLDRQARGWAGRFAGARPGGPGRGEGI